MYVCVLNKKEKKNVFLFFGIHLPPTTLTDLGVRLPENILNVLIGN